MSRFKDCTIRFDLYSSLSTRPLEPNEIIISNYDIAITTLQYHGNSIKKLSFNGEMFKKHEMIEISHHIAEYTSKTLMEISLINVDDFLLSTTNRSFTNVTSVKIQCDKYADKMKLYQIYPKMQRFQFVFQLLGVPLSSLVQYYNRLEHLELLDSGGILGENVNIRPIIEMNPHIQSLVLNRFPERELLQVINEYLPLLKSLSLTMGFLDSYEKERSVHFNGVKSFVIDCMHSGWDWNDTFDRFPITFERLEVLDIKTWSLDDISMRLIEQNEQLKELSLTEMDTSGGLSRVLSSIKHLHELEVITVQWFGNISQGDTLRLMNGIGKLKTITFILSKWSDLGVLKAMVPNEWSQSASGAVSSRKWFVTFGRS